MPIDSRAPLGPGVLAPPEPKSPKGDEVEPGGFTLWGYVLPLPLPVGIGGGEDDVKGRRPLHRDLLRVLPPFSLPSPLPPFHLFPLPPSSPSPSFPDKRPPSISLPRPSRSSRLAVPPPHLTRRPTCPVKPRRPCGWRRLRPATRPRPPRSWHRRHSSPLDLTCEGSPERGKKEGGGGGRRGGRE